MRYILFLSLLLVGCATNKSLHYGVYLNQISTAASKEMAADTVKQLTETYSPAATRIEIKQPTTDDYGKTLIEILRAKGYAVAEYNPATDAKTSQYASQSINLKYIIDQVQSLNVYRLTLFIDTQPLSRVYTAQNGMLRPAGAWSKRSDKDESR